jgi:hypothetical protein
MREIISSHLVIFPEVLTTNLLENILTIYIVCYRVVSLQKNELQNNLSQGG